MPYVLSTSSRMPWISNLCGFDYFGNWLECLGDASQKVFWGILLLKCWEILRDNKKFEQSFRNTCKEAQFR